MNVLIIADDPYVNGAIEKGVHQFDAACTIFEVSSPQEALNLMRAVPMHIVFSEIDMREMNGLTFIERHGNFSAKASWVVISACKNFRDIQKAIRLGAEDYLLKPLDESGIYDLLKHRLIHKANAYAHSVHPCASCT